MRSLISPFVSLIIAALCCACSSRYDVYLLIGQSNMAGRGILEAADTLQAAEGVFLLDGQGTAVPARNPLNRYSTIRKVITMQGMGPGWSFGQAVHARTGRPVLLVVNARGGSTLQMWLPDAPAEYYGRGDEDPENIGQRMPSLYDEAIRRTRQALRYGKLKGILWHQGESGVDADNVGDYLPVLARFVAALRSDLGVDERVPFLAGEILPEYEPSAFINPMLQQIGDYIPNARCVSAAGLQGNPDRLHFSRESQLEFGRRYAAALEGKD